MMAVCSLSCFPRRVQHLIEFSFSVGGINLATATKLKEVEIRFNQWLLPSTSRALSTIPDNHGVEQVSIHLPSFASEMIARNHRLRSAYGKDEELDDVLIRLSESPHPFCVKVIAYTGCDGEQEEQEQLTDEGLKHYMELLLPEMTKKGIEIKIVVDNDLTWFNKKLP